MIQLPARVKLTEYDIRLAIEAGAGLRVHESDWVDPGKMVVLWNENGRLARLERVNFCC